MSPNAVLKEVHFKGPLEYHPCHVFRFISVLLVLSFGIVVIYDPPREHVVHCLMLVKNHTTMRVQQSKSASNGHKKSPQESSSALSAASFFRIVPKWRDQIITQLVGHTLSKNGNMLILKLRTSRRRESFKKTPLGWSIFSMTIISRPGFLQFVVTDSIFTYMYFAQHRGKDARFF